MIVICERCDTRFQLDDARVPGTGARVRCSRCKHAFLVLPPDTSGDETVHAFAEAAAASGEPTPPSVTDDLREPIDAESKAASEEESEWQFAEQPRPEPAPARPRKKEPVADLWEGVLEPEKPPEALELDALGNPESWSFVSEEAPPLRPARSAPTPDRGSAETRAGTPVAIGRLRAPTPAPAVLEVMPEPVASPHARILDRIGWAATGLLLLAIVVEIDWRGAPAPIAPAVLPLRDGLVAENLSLRRLENLVAGPILVVTGSIANPGSAPAGSRAHLRARVIGADGRAEAEAGAPRSREELREASLDASGADAPLFDAPLAPGARIPFEAIIVPVPRGELALELRLEPASQGTGARVAPGAGAEAERPATGGPSPPTPLPSSG